MAFATSADVVKALRRALTTTETMYVGDVIAEAQDLVLGYLGQDPSVNGVAPDAVTRVTARMAARVFQQDDGRAIGGSQVQRTAGPFSTGTSYVAASTSGSPWLAASDKQVLKPYRKGGGMTSVAFGTERGYDTVATDDEA
jgi:hypothetical protein